MIRSLFPAIRFAAALLFTAIVALLVVRRLAGAFWEPLPSGALVLLGLIFAISAVLVRQALAATLPILSNVGRQSAGTLVAVGGAAMSVWLPGTSALGLLALWLPIAVEEGWSWRNWFASRNVGVPPSEELGAPEFEAVKSNEPEVITLDSALSELAFADTTVTQHLVRRQEPDGVETVSGCLRAAFQPGERTVNVHVPFCPPLAVLPECSAETIDGPPARVKVAQVLPQGARLEVRLDSAATEPQQVVVEFSTA